MSPVKDKDLWEEAFKNANAIVALEGGKLTPEVAGIQKAIANGVSAWPRVSQPLSGS